MVERLSRAGIEIKVVRNRRARRLSLTVNGRGEVRLTLPMNVNEEEAWRFVERKTDWIIESVKRQLSRPQPQCNEQSIDELNRLIREANSYLPERIQYISKTTGLKYNNLSITRARTRWGSCSTQNNISLSFYLMQLPKHLIDFVIVHELCHTIHHNHSAAFHELVNRIMGGKEAQLDKELREFKTS